MEKEKRLYIEVSPVYEFECMFDLYEDLVYPIPEAYQQKVTEAEVESWRAELQKVREKFGSVFQVQPPNPLYPYDSTEQRINAFSGTTIVVPLGKGVLNFCYADFQSAFAHCAAVYQKLTRTADDPKKIHYVEEGVIHLYELYTEVFPVLSEVFYSSIHTAAFPPQFTRKTETALMYYRRYLLFLQSEFLELIEFCLDKSYRPEVLARLYPSERYSLWCKIKGVPACHTNLSARFL